MQRPMPNITEHNPKLQWERDNREQSRVNFLIGRNPIDIDHVLTHIANVVDLKEGWRDSSRVIPVFLLNKVRFNFEFLVVIIELIQFGLDFVDVAGRDPALCFDGCVSTSETVDHGVNHLFLLHC